MIREFEKYHGAVLCRLCSGPSPPLSIARFSKQSNAAYVLNNCCGLYIKHSGARLSPWSFTFRREHQDEILKLNESYGEVFVVLVCHDDGAVVLNFQELKEIMDEDHQATEWISVQRRPGRMYTVKGKDGRLKFKPKKSDLPEKILEYIATSKANSRKRLWSLFSSG